MSPGPGDAGRDGRGWSGADFSGAKLVAVHKGRLLTYRRDFTPGIPFQGCHDLPGGGREGAESPADCALRELAEEFGLVLPPSRMLWWRRWDYSWNSDRPSYLLGMALTAQEIAAVRFGDEGLDWRMMTIDDFVAAIDAVPHLRARVAACRFLLCNMTGPA